MSLWCLPFYLLSLCLFFSLSLSHPSAEDKPTLKNWNVALSLSGLAVAGATQSSRDHLSTVPLPFCRILSSASIFSVAKRRQGEGVLWVSDNLTPGFIWCLPDQSLTAGHANLKSTAVMIAVHDYPTMALLLITSLWLF